MSGYVDWIAAVADDAPCPKPVEPGGDEQSLSKPSVAGASWQSLPAHNFPAQPAAPDEAQMQDDPLDRNPDLWMYRKRTVGLLRRYLRFSLETGRLPSFIGREFFRAKMTCYTATTFEDRVIFVRDVEKSLERMEYWDQQLIARIIFQEHSHEQAAHFLHCSRSTLERRFPFVLDLLSEDFLRVGLLAEVPTTRRSS
jgi:hypothetical protein